MTTRQDTFRRMGARYREEHPQLSNPQPQVASDVPSYEPTEPLGTRTALDFTNVNTYIEFDGVRISRGGMPFTVGHHFATPNEVPWNYAIFAPGTDSVRFLIEFLNPVRAWQIRGTCYINGGQPAWPFSYSWFENPVYNDPVAGDISNHPITAPVTHNKGAVAFPGGLPTGMIWKAECGVYLGQNENGTYYGQPELNGFIGGYMQWER